MGILPLVFRCVLAAVFVVAGVGKLLDLPGSRRAMEEFGLPASQARLAGVLLPCAELAVAGALLVNASARYGGVAALLLLALFVGGVWRAISQGRAPDCHCFGQVHSEPAGPSTIVRNLILAGIAAVVVATGAGIRFPAGVSDLDGTQIALAAAAILAILLALATAQLWGAARRLRRDLEAAHAAARQPGLPRGSQAPEFALTPLRGDAGTLADLLEAGRPAVLVFVSTGCGPCLQMLPDLARWQDSLAESLTLGVIFSGDRQEVEQLAAEHGLSIALAQEANETFELYGLRATPSGLEIASDGTIASAPAEGLAAIEALVRTVLSRTSEQRFLVHQG
jgi:uncharacterized membrane protein YphA (DoxX/SURF4 family)/thiol-disulfide isomerase/thioredoxin